MLGHKFPSGVDTAFLTGRKTGAGTRSASQESSRPTGGVMSRLGVCTARSFSAFLGPSGRLARDRGVSRTASQSGKSLLCPWHGPVSAGCRVTFPDGDQRPHARHRVADHREPPGRALGSSSLRPPDTCRGAPDTLGRRAPLRGERTCRANDHALGKTPRRRQPLRGAGGSWGAGDGVGQPAADSGVPRGTINAGSDQ